MSLDISSIVDGQANVMVRFHYWDPNTSDDDWYVQIDDVMMWEYVSRAGIPTLSPAGIVALLLLLSGVAVLILRRRS